MVIKTSEEKSVKDILSRITLPKADSHKGQNGKLLVIGGSSLFHSAPIWAAETASHLVDMVHFASTKENNEIMKSLKKQFHNGMVIPQTEIESYAKEDNVILIGPGMMRDVKKTEKSPKRNLEQILSIVNEGELTAELTKFLIEKFPEKRFVLDAGVLQMISPDLLLSLKTAPIITPHQKEFESLFNIDITKESLEKKEELVKSYAEKYHCVILLKAVSDIVSDGKKVVRIEGGNAGLTKGGTGDVLAGLCASFYTKNSAVDAACFASIILKRTADSLLLSHGYWYNTHSIIEEFPRQMHSLINSL